MRRTWATWTRDARGLLAVLLALVVALRVVAAPVILSGPEPGVMAICSGGQIYYVTLDGTPVEGDAPEADPCPFMGIPLALADIADPLPSMRGAERPLGVAIPQARVAAHARPRANAARAPPFPV